MSNSKSGNGYTQKELNQMILDKLDKIEEKLDTKLDKSELYKVLGLIATVAMIIGTFIMGV